MPKKKNNMLQIDLNNSDFGTVLNCAVRYSLGRTSYMPSLVIDYITPLIPILDDRTLWCLDQDIANAKWETGYGDPNIDEPLWMNFHDRVKEERLKRGHTLFKSWREDDE